jgi:ATP-dependent DNA helicase DinG
VRVGHAGTITREPRRAKAGPKGDKTRAESGKWKAKREKRKAESGKKEGRHPCSRLHTRPTHSLSFRAFRFPLERCPTTKSGKTLGMADVAERFTAAAATALRAAIVDAGGNEVFVLGTLAGGLVSEIRVLARGNRAAVPAIMQVPRPGEVVIHNHPSGQLVPSDADLAIASALGNNGVGAYIVDGDVADVYVVVEPLAAPRVTPLDGAAAVDLLNPDGAVGAVLAAYEHRPQQLAMLRAVADAFNDDEVLSVEAGTGTGKSLAYLIPAILWSQANQRRVVISTHTINLQEQLIKKDLPLLVEGAGLTCRTALVKGRGNYLCRRKAAQAQAQGAQLIEDDLLRELEGVLAWAKHTADGSLADLPVRPRPEVWEQVVSEHDNCLRARCPFYSSCFFYGARRAAAAADILVVNHHLLLADLALRSEIGNYTQNAVLPPSARVIVDEAQHLEDVATAHFGQQVSLAMLERTLGRLRSRRSPGRGVLPALALALGSVGGATDAIIAHGAADRIDQRLMAGCTSIASEAEECFIRLLDAYLALPERREALGSAPPARSDGNAGAAETEKLRITDPVRATAFWRFAVERVTALATALDAYAVDIGGVLERVQRLSDDVEAQIRYLGTELGALAGRLSAMALALLGFLEDDAAHCAWIEMRPRGRGGPTLSLHRAPVEVGPLLHAALFKPFATCVLTSATLSVNGGFDHLHERVGIDRVEPPERVRTMRVESPFDFATQAMLLVPTDLPEPTLPSYEAASHAAMREILAIARGGTFLLFTAYGALNRAWFELAGALRAHGLSPLRQGELSRHVLLTRFVQEPGAVLFATDSFWEGVDVRGEALRCVVITRLPFRVPTEPLEQARVDAIAARGGNPFSERALPQAVIKLKQGFGRLIRTRNDRGCVVVLDSRLARKRYGRVFLDSLPPARQVVAPQATVFASMRRFFA